MTIFRNYSKQMLVKIVIFVKQTLVEADLWEANLSRADLSGAKRGKYEKGDYSLIFGFIFYLVFAFFLFRSIKKDGLGFLKLKKIVNSIGLIVFVGIFNLLIFFLYLLGNATV